MKGISAVLATVLIVVITVAIIGMAYGWSTGLFETVSGASEEGTENIVSNMNKRVDIASIRCDVSDGQCSNYLTFTVKNTGTGDIEAGDLNAFVNEEKIDNIFYESTKPVENMTLSGDQVIQTVYTSTDESYFNEETEVTLKIITPSEDEVKTITCPAIIYCGEYNPGIS